MKKFLDGIMYGLFLWLGPFIIVIFLSQSSVPGDFLYPIKRGTENVGLILVAIDPHVRASFHTTLAEKRFVEAEKLLVKSDTRGLDNFMVEMKATEQVISSLQSSTQKQQLTNKLIASINEYEVRLNNAQTAPGASFLPPSPSPSSLPSPRSESPPSSIRTSRQTFSQTSSNSTLPNPTTAKSSPVEIAPPTSSTPPSEPGASTAPSQIINQTIDQLEQIKQDLEKGKKKNEANEEDKKEKNIKDNQKDSSENKDKENKEDKKDKDKDK